MSDDGKNGLRVAVLVALRDTVNTELDRVKADGAPAWKMLKEQGFPHQKIQSPTGGKPLGRLEFTGDTPQIDDVDEAALLGYVRKFEAKAAIVERVDPAAFNRADVIALIKSKFPDLVHEVVRDSIRTGLVEEAKKGDGRVLHPDGSGESTVIGKVTKTPVEGKVRWCPEKDTAVRVMTALGNGTIGHLGLWPLEIATAPPPAIVQAVPEPEAVDHAA